MMPSWITRLKYDIDSDVKFLLSQIHVKFSCQRLEPRFQVVGLHFSDFHWAGHAYCASCLFQFSIMASESESSFVTNKAILGNVSDDEFKNNLPDYPSEEEESNEEEDLDEDGLTLWEAAILKSKISRGKSKAKSEYGAKAGKGKTKGKPGRKAVWSDHCTNDLVDIICSSDTYQKNLIFTNIKTAKNGEYYAKIVEELKRRCEERNEEFTYDIAQTREKFKRCISHCKWQL